MATILCIINLSLYMISGGKCRLICKRKVLFSKLSPFDCVIKSLRMRALYTALLKEDDTLLLPLPEHST